MAMFETAKCILCTVFVVQTFTICSGFSQPNLSDLLAKLLADREDSVPLRSGRASSSSSSADIDTTYYHSYDDLSFLLQKYASDYPAITNLSSVGQSVQGRELWVMQITDNPGVVENGEPWFKYVGNMHGNEVIGRQILIYLIEYLLQNYGTDDQVTQLVDETNIYIVPTMNPDGFHNSVEGQCRGRGRENANGIDLNRNFPDQYHTDHADKWKNRQPETELMMRWIESNPFVLSANMHGGSLVASYPFDDYQNHRTHEIPQYSKSPDDDLFKQLATVYSNNHKTMHSQNGCPGGSGETTFHGGVTNGAAWYDVPGGMQDFNYMSSNCYEITIELSCCKYPHATALTREWNNNKAALLAYMEMVHIGIKGSVLDSFDGSAIVGASISVATINHDVKTVQYGNYWRLLLPGNYKITASADGYESQTKDVVVPEEGVRRLDFRLRSTTNSYIEPEPIQHHTHDATVAFLNDHATRFPHITRLYSIGSSEQGKDLMVLEISDNPGIHEPGEPEMKYVAGIHGNEIVGGEMVILLIQFLCENYESSEQVRWLVDNTRIHIMPSMNPDGKAIANEGDSQSVHGRANHHNVDLNRNFPDRFQRQEGTVQRETEAVMLWTQQYPFVISAGLHGGSVVANYPYDGNKQDKNVYTRCPDDASFREISLAFSNAHGMMYKGHPCPKDYPNEIFEDGITNGAAWYALYGGMQDWNYLNTDTMEITVEMSCVKFPWGRDLPKYWNDNKMSLITFIYEAHRGVKGFVVNEAGEGIPQAHVLVQGIARNVSTAKFGDFWRPLAPGVYNVVVHADGYRPQSQEVVVDGDMATQVNFTMTTNNPQSGNDQPDVPYSDWAAQHDFSIPQNFSSYLSNDNLTATLLEYQALYAEVMDLSPLGQTRSGGNIWAVEMGVRRDVENVINMPRVALIGGLKGEEPVGREMLWRFIHHLGEGYKVGDGRVSRLLNSTQLTIIPAVDYDGFALAHETDCSGSLYEGDLTANSFGPDGSLLSPRPELKALEDLFNQHNYTLILSLEASGKWVRYPYDNPTADNVAAMEDGMLFFEIANAYASANPTLTAGKKCKGSTFGAGVVIGADLKVTRNTLQDYLYTQKNEIMMTAHVSCCKYPEHTELEGMWRDNLESLMLFAEKSHQGIVGRVETADGTPLTSALVHHGDHTHVMTVDGMEGMFRRLIETGRHGMTASAPGYMPLTKEVEVSMNQVTDVVFQLQKEPRVRYHQFDDIERVLKNMTTLFPKLTSLKSIGKSVEGRDLWVLEISDMPGTHQPGRPEVKFIGSIHGNEPVGKEIVLALASYLLNSYGSDDDITKLLRTSHIHILPTMNPDGGEHSRLMEGTCYGDEEGKTNAHGVNLENDFSMDSLNLTSELEIQPETRAVAEWLASRPFTLGVSLYGGTLVARYPYNADKEPGGIERTADDTLFKHLAKTYAKMHPTMHQGKPQCPGNDEETYGNGIVNGAEMKQQENNLQDFTYDRIGCLDLAIHTSCCLYPAATELQTLWHNHRPALIEMIKQTHHGVKGFVHTTEGYPIEGAAIAVKGLARPGIKTSAKGDFWLLLPNGHYSISAEAEGHSSRTLDAEVGGSTVLVVNFELPEETSILGFPILLFLGMLALSFAFVLLTIVLITRCCRSRKLSPHKRGFYRLDGEESLMDEEYHDDVALKTFKNGSKKKLLKNIEFHDISESDSEDEDTFRR